MNARTWVLVVGVLILVLVLIRYARGPEQLEARGERIVETVLEEVAEREAGDRGRDAGDEQQPDEVARPRHVVAPAEQTAPEATLLLSVVDLFVLAVSFLGIFLLFD